MPHLFPNGDGKETVVLVHGLWMTGFDLSLLAWRLSRCGFRTERFHYASVRRALADNARRLARYLERVEGDNVHFVAHSLGGLVVRELFRRYPEQRPGRIVTLGTPHHPSVVARRLRRGHAGRLLLGRSARALTEELPPWDGKRELGVIAGSLPLGVGRLFEGFRGANDGTVRVEETRLDGAADHVVLPVSHMGLVFAASAAEQTCQFLKTGRFVRASGDTRGGIRDSRGGLR